MKNLLIAALILGCIAHPAFAESKTAKACEFSKRTLGKHPHCQSLVPEADAVNCADADALNKINAIQAKCKTLAESGSAKTTAKLNELKTADPSDPKIQEIKKKLEERRAAKAAAGK